MAYDGFACAMLLILGLNFMVSPWIPTITKEQIVEPKMGECTKLNSAVEQLRLEIEILSHRVWDLSGNTPHANGFNGVPPEDIGVPGKRARRPTHTDIHRMCENYHCKAPLA